MRLNGNWFLIHNFVILELRGLSEDIIAMNKKDSLIRKGQKTF